MKKFKPTNKLEKLLVKAAKKPAVLPKFYSELVSGNVYAIPLNRPSIRGGMAAKGEKLQLLGYKHNEVFFIAFFTSEERVAETNVVSGGYIRLNGLDFLKMTHGSYLVLNPGSGLGREFFPHEISNVIQGLDC